MCVCDEFFNFPGSVGLGLRGMLEFGGSEADKLLDFLIFRLFFLEKIKFVLLFIIIVLVIL